MKIRCDNSRTDPYDPPYGDTASRSLPCFAAHTSLTCTSGFVDTTYAYDPIGRPITINLPTKPGDPTRKIRHLYYQDATTTIDPDGRGTTRTKDIYGRLVMASSGTTPNLAAYCAIKISFK